MFPLVVLALFVTLVSLNLSGSSIGVLSEDQAGVLAGTPRSVRSDEALLTTPIAVSSVRQGFPPSQWIGLNRVDQSAVTLGGPTWDWTSAFKPQDWGYLLLGPGAGLAVKWWTPVAVSLIGLYVMVLVLTRSTAVGVVMAVIGTFTPYAAWWHSSAPGLVLGLAALVGALLITSWRAGDIRVRWAAAIASGIVGTAFAILLYPPWLVSVALVIAASCLGVALAEKLPWRRVLGCTAVSLVTTAFPMGAWFVQHRDAIEIQSKTLYPGQRFAVGGSGSLAQLIDAPLNFWLSHETGVTLGPGNRWLPYANSSEAASGWLPLPVLVLLLAGLIEVTIRRRRADVPAQVSLWPVIMPLAMGGTLLAWSLLGLPSVLAQVLLLDRVQPSRLPLALTLVVLVALAAATRIADRPVAWRWPFLAGTGIATALLTPWASDRLPWQSDLVSLPGALASGLVVGLGFAAFLLPRARVLTGGVLAVYAFVSWAQVNPLQRGIAPLTDSALTKALHRLASKSDNPRVSVFSETNGYSLVALVRAAGMQSLTGTTPYPNPELMGELAPGQRDLWNNYAQYVWSAAPEGSEPRISQIKGTLMQFSVAPCDARILKAAQPGWVVSDRPLPGECLTRVERVQSPKTWIYRVTP